MSGCKCFSPNEKHVLRLLSMNWGYYMYLKIQLYIPLRRLWHCRSRRLVFSFSFNATGTIKDMDGNATRIHSPALKKGCLDAFILERCQPEKSNRRQNQSWKLTLQRLCCPDWSDAAIHWIYIKYLEKLMVSNVVNRIIDLSSQETNQRRNPQGAPPRFGSISTWKCLSSLRAGRSKSSLVCSVSFNPEEIADKSGEPEDVYA